ncbi:MAG: TonB-dependent receptor [Sphingomonadaceae bacterium]|nr:TonB-dependent receptor [Sphingomonadaceae bacterium]
MVASRILFALPLLALGSPALAEEADAEQIIVTGQGLPETPAAPAYSTIEIDRDAVISSASGRVEDVLLSVAGFQQFRRSDSRSANPTAQGVTLRALGGNATSRALVLLDGVPVADPFFGHIPFNALAPEQLARIRVTRGGGAGSFGAGALAGTIEMESADADMLDPVMGSLLANDRGGTEASASLSQQLGGGFVVASGRWDRDKGFYTTPVSERVPATTRARNENWSVQLRGVAPLSETVELQARGLVFKDDRTLRFDGADNGTEGADASLRLVGRGEWQFDAIAYVQSRNFNNVVISSTRFVPVLDQRNTPATGLGGKLELRPPVSESHVLRLGVDYRRASGELQEEAYSAFSGNLTEARRAGGRTSDLGLFVEDDFTLGALVLTGGLRADYTRIENGFYTARDASRAIVSQTISPDRSDWTVSWRAGATWQAGDALRLRAATYRGLRLPTLNELYRPFVVFPVVTQANADLKNEILTGFEAGIDLTPAEGVSVSLTAFDNRVENAIANVTIGTNLRQRQNLPAIDAQGVELAASLGSGPISFDGTLSWTDATVDGRGTSLALDGLRPSQTPRWAASATLGWKPKDGWLLSATLRHVGKQFESDQETDVLPAATTLDAFATVPLAAGFALVLRGENLLDETIVTRNSGGSIDLGTPRTIWGGLRFGF